MAIKEVGGLLRGTHGEIVEALSQQIGIKIFPGDEKILKDLNILGVQAGTHRVDRFPDTEGNVHSMIVSNNLPKVGEQKI